MLQFFVATGICIYCSAQEHIQLPNVQSIDKIFHFFAYFIYGLSLQVFFIALFSKRELNKKKYILLTMIIGFTFAISDEIHQYYVPGRSADILDVLMDWSGISLSLLCFGVVKKVYSYIGI
jgi:VanZ family protein